jgi:hypothetical protein
MVALCDTHDLQLMVDPQDLSGTLANDHTGSHGIAGGHARHDGSIGNTPVFDSIDLRLRSTSDMESLPILAVYV